MTTITETLSLRDRLATDLGISAGDTVTVIYDEENSADVWWDAARKIVRSDAPCDLSAPARKLFQKVSERGKAVTTRLDAAELFAWGEEIEGWDDGPEHARNPLLTYEGSDDDA
jgi:hypothetical protein